MSFQHKSYRSRLKCIRSKFSNNYVVLFTTIATIGGIVNDIFIPTIQELIGLKFRYLGTVIVLGGILVYLLQTLYQCEKMKSKLNLYLIHISRIQFSINEMEEIVSENHFRDLLYLDVGKFQSSHHPSDWESGKNYQDSFFENHLQTKLHQYHEVHYIGIVPIPFVIQLGYLFGNKLNIRYYERRRSNTVTSNPWIWSREEIDPKWSIQVRGRSLNTKGKVVLVSIEQSYTIDINELPNLSDNSKKIQVKVPTPSIYDLQSEKQLIVIAKELSEVFDTLNDCESIHIFAAVPVATAFVIGQNIKKSVNPQVVIYRYKKSSDAKYKEVFRLNTK